MSSKRNSLRDASTKLNNRDKVSTLFVFLVIICYYVEEMMIGSEHSREGPLFFLWAERSFAFFFTYEFVARWKEQKWHWRYLYSPVAIIDLLSFTPFYVGFFVANQYLHLIRTLRILRLMKLIQFLPGVNLLGLAILRAWPQIRTILFVQIIVTMFATAAIYECERNVPDTSFTSLFDSIWFTAVTVTTVGYGDITPTSVIGRLIALATFITGLILFGVFAGMIGGAVTDVLDEHREANE
tara:strand:+ start:451 stop:1170 length:720 start_codon:yes stop_codon:yes gene_type:complete